MTLRLRDSCVSFPQPDGAALQVLRGVGLDVGTGESVAVLGRSGSGKTTLLNVLGLLLPLRHGTYEIDGVRVDRVPEKDLARMRGAVFGFVFQEYLLMSRRSVLQNVCMPVVSAPARQWRSRRELAREALDAVGLSGKESARPTQLSGGQQQRVAIARALVRDPRYVLADEPTGALDPETGQGVIDLLLRLVRDRGKSLVLVTHDREIAAQCDRTLVIQDGLLSRVGSRR